MKKTIVYLVYDGQCPLCDNYCQMVKIKQTVGELVLLDARHDSVVLDKITQAKLDIDQGMVLMVNDVIYYAADAIHVLSLMSSRVGIFNQMNYWFFRSKRLSRLTYPLLRSCRNLLLKLLSRKKINNLDLEDNSRF